jgi:hypothetical protein
VSLSLRVEHVAGDTIEGIAPAMQALADRVEIDVLCEANGLQLLAVPGGSADRLVRDYYGLAGRGHQARGMIASSRA